MNPIARKKLEIVRTALADAVSSLGPADYKEVLEELDSDIEGRLDALGDEIDDED